jgi:hypothetical protein
MGAITVGNAMMFMMSYNKVLVTAHTTAEAIRDTAMVCLSRAVAS